MATCDVCGNNYDKSFTLQQGGRSGRSNARSTHSHRAVHTAIALLSGMVLKETARSSAAHTAPVIQV